MAVGGCDIVCCASEYGDPTGSESDESDRGLLCLRRMCGRCNGVGVVGGGLSSGDGCPTNIYAKSGVSEFEDAENGFCARATPTISLYAFG